MSTHKISTIQDVFEATNHKNIDNFLKDLKLIMIGAYLIRDEIGEDNCKDLFSESVEWINDGKHNIEFFLKDGDVS